MDILERLTGGLLLVIMTVWIGAYLYSKLYGLPLKAKDGIIKVLTNTPIGPKKSISLVKVADEYIVIGTTPDTITYLTRLEHPEALKDIGPESSKGVSPRSRKLFGKGISLMTGVKR